MFNNMLSNILGGSSKREESYYAFLNGTSSGITVTVVDCNTEEINPLLSTNTHARDVKKFVSDFSTTFKEYYKAIILNVFYFITPEYPNNIEFCEILKQKLLELNIPFHFMSTEIYLPSALLIAANLILQPGEEVLVALADTIGMGIMELRRTNDGYEFISQRKVYAEDGDDFEIYKKKIYGNCNNPKKIIAAGGAPNLKMIKVLRKILKSNKLIVFEVPYNQHTRKFLIETCQWLLNKTKKIQYYIKPTCARKLFITHESKSIENFILSIAYNESLPTTKKCRIPRSSKAIYFTHCWDSELNNIIIIQTLVPGILLRHFDEIILSVDTENFPSVEFKQIMLPEIEEFPQKLDNKIMQIHIPFIGFFGNASVICCFNNEIGKYEFLNSWNGVYGKDLFLNVEVKNPVLEDDKFEGTAAKSVISFNEICSLILFPTSETKLSGSSFKISSDNQHPILIEFDYFNGKRRKSTPQFLMALIIKEHYLEIKKQTGMKPQKLGLLYVCENENNNKNEIENLLKKSCDLLNLECDIPINL